MSDLTFERAIEVLRYDAQNGVLERKLKNGEWRVCGHKPICYGYSLVGIDGKMYLAHRLIWLLVNGEWPDGEIDHINQNKMDNRLENLRVVSSSENQHNKGLQRNNTSGYPGVCFNKQRDKYMSRTAKAGKRIHLGYFDTPEEAFRTYMLAKIEYHPTSPIAQEYLRELTLAD